MMATFIAGRIMAAAEISLSDGQQKYRVYFVNPNAKKLYGRYQADVELILQTTDSDKYPTGYGDCIVTA
jgi:hypothetical protein